VFGLLLAALPLTVWSALDIENTAPVISEQQAIGLALNRIMASQETITVTNLHHRAVFDRSGVQFTPARGPDWHWQLTQINSARQAAVTPKHSASDTVDFTRAGLIERYLIKADTIEQRFVLDRPWPKGRDLIITGAIASPGKMETTDHGWVWRDASGVVTLGQVTVFDAAGNTLAATMVITTDSSTITIAAIDLAGATYPVTIDPEIGTNDFRISDMGSRDDFISLDAASPSVAYNAIANEYLVVWHGDDDTDDLVDGEFEIYGQRLDAVTGAERGTNDFRISDMGAKDGVTDFSASNPAVAWNAIDNEYLVVWVGDDDTDDLIAGEFEVYGQRLDGATGAERGTNDFRISDMGATDGVTDFSGSNPAVAWNATANEYLVVWSGDDVAILEFEIFGQYLNGATGKEVGNDFQISDMGTNLITDRAAFTPAVAWNATANEYLVVWSGDDDTGVLDDNGFEIFGQRLNGAGGEVGDNDFQISDMGPDMGPDLNADLAAFTPAVAWNASANEYLVVWSGDDKVLDGFEIFGQLFSATTQAGGGGGDGDGDDDDDNFLDDFFGCSLGSNAANDPMLLLFVLLSVICLARRRRGSSGQ
jgi:roadblock/LC7 domain-containing protein